MDNMNISRGLTFQYYYFLHIKKIIREKEGKTRVKIRSQEILQNRKVKIVEGI